MTKRLVDVIPLRTNGSGDLYTLRDAARAIFGAPKIKTEAQAKTRKLAAEADLAELKLEEMRGDLVDSAEMKKAAMRNGRVEREALLNWPDRIGADLAAKLEVDPGLLVRCLEEELRTYMEERAGNDGL
ncbi:MAG: hypothetical protein QNJ62_06455 [Methyloceanibacter sp.]|nr:hypothetical protein [Methyloceanibacter sp.]